MTGRPPAPGLALLVHRPGEPPVQHYAGTAHLETGTPIGPGTAFNVGSVAKQITAHLALLADRDHRINLARPAADLLPQLKIPDVTIADLITHHGGIRDAESLLPFAGFRDLDHYTAADLLALAYRQDQRAVPAGRFLYSNTGYLMLTRILELVHGTDLSTIAENQLFAPLGMTKTVFKDDPRRLVPGAASSYRQAAGGSGWEHAEQPVALPGPGSLWTTAADLDCWLAHLHAQWQDSGTPLPGADRVPYQPSDHPPDTYGPGLYSASQTDHAAVFHLGHEQGFSAAVYLDREGLRVIALSNNAHATADQAASRIVTALRRAQDVNVRTVLEQLAGPSSQPATTPAKPEPKATGDHPHTMIGTFTCNQVPGSVRLSRSNGDLYLWRRGTHDRLHQTGLVTYAGTNYVLSLLRPDAAIDRFVLDLDRAPGLHYHAKPR